MESHDSFEAANRRAKKLQSSLPQAVSARYDRRIGRIVIRLDSKFDLAFPPRDAQGLEGARPEELDPIEISPQDSVSTFQSWMPTSIYLRCWRAFLVQRVGWRADLAQREAVREARLKPQR